MRDVHSDDPRDARYWPINLPPRARVRTVRRMLAAGKCWSRIERATGITPNRISYIKRDPHAWDTKDDEVAIERALSGDRSVLPALTLYERARVREALVLKLEERPYEAGIDHDTHWLNLLADSWGVDRAKLRNRLTQRARRTVAA